MLRCAGNAPTLMAMRDLRKVAPHWVNVSRAIFDDKEAHEARCQDLFAFTSTSALQCIWHRLKPVIFTL